MLTMLPERRAKRTAAPSFGARRRACDRRRPTAGGQPVTITGTGLQTGATVVFSGSGITLVTSSSTTTANVGGTELSFHVDVSTANAGLGDHTIAITNPDGGAISATGTFTDCTTLPTVARKTVVTGVAYDPGTGRLFLGQGFADGDSPVVHVFTVG